MNESLVRVKVRALSAARGEKRSLNLMNRDKQSVQDHGIHLMYCDVWDLSPISPNSPEVVSPHILYRPLCQRQGR